MSQQDKPAYWFSTFTVRCSGKLLRTQWGISDDREPKTLREEDVKARTIKSSFPLNILHLRVRNLVRESGMMEIGRKQEVLVNLTLTLELISMAHQRPLYSNSSTNMPI